MQSRMINSKSTSVTDMGASTDNIMLMTDITYENNTGKFIIPVITPSMGKDLVDSPIPKGSTSNIINRDNLGLTKITSSNYFELVVPRHLFTIKEITIDPNLRYSDGYVTSSEPKATIVYNEFKKGQMFIATYTKANKESPVIIGVIPND